MTLNKQVFEKQLDELLELFLRMQQQAQYDDLSDLPSEELQGIATRAIAAVRRAGGLSSSYSTDIERIINDYPYLHVHLPYVMGVVRALKNDIGAGYLQSLEELAHAAVFADFLDMSHHLCDTGYKDAAAVIAGSALEGHIRNLCAKNGIAVDRQTSAGGVRPKKADLMNAELSKASVYSKLDQKNITAWLELRNKAAHGHSQAHACYAGIFVRLNPDANRDDDVDFNSAIQENNHGKQN